MLLSVESEEIDNAVCCSLPKNLLQYTINIGERRPVFEAWQAIVAYDRVDLSLRGFHHRRVQDHHDQKSLEGH